MNLSQMCERLIANGQNMYLFDNEARTNDGYNSLEILHKIHKTDNKWVISRIAYGKIEVGRSFSKLEDACLSFFLERLDSIFFDQIDKKHRGLNLFPETIEKIKDLLETTNYPKKYYTFSQKDVLKDCFWIKSENDKIKVQFYGTNGNLIDTYPSFPFYDLNLLPMLRAEEQILLKEGILNEPLSDDNVVRFLRNYFTYQ